VSETQTVSASSDEWSSGWWSRAAVCPSPNHGPRPQGAAIDLVIVHSISLPPGQYGGDAIERLFTNRLDWSAHPYFETIRGLEVSSHFVVRRTGQVQQFVSCDARAWHAGRSEWDGRENCNDFSIGIELEGLEGETFERLQYASLARVMRAIAGIYPIRSVAGHEHVAHDRKQDPGPGFDWPLLRSEVGDLGWRFPL
jgi:N-acetyl-anhydromuramoyl-L-alanine amidase